MTRRRLARALAAAGFALCAFAATAYAASMVVTPQNLTAWDAPTSVPSCSSPGSQTVTAIRDTYVDQGSPNSNFGTSSDLFVQSKSGSQNRRMLLGFTLPATPNGCSVTAATLRVFSVSGVSGRTIHAYLASASWTETSVRWSTQPAASGTAVSAGSSSSSVWINWSVTVHVQNLYSSGVNNGFLLRDATEDTSSSPEQKYQSREGSPNDPELVVTFG